MDTLAMIKAAEKATTNQLVGLRIARPGTYLTQSGSVYRVEYSNGPVVYRSPGADSTLPGHDEEEFRGAAVMCITVESNVLDENEEMILVVDEPRHNELELVVRSSRISAFLES